jgi:hypothetical protein
VLKERLGNSKTDNSDKAKNQSDPTDGIDRFGKEPAGQQGNHQGLRINQNGTETCASAFKSPGETDLKQQGINQGEQEEPTPIPRINR